MAAQLPDQSSELNPGTFSIDPLAEAGRGAASSVSAQDEATFYEKGAAEYQLKRQSQDLGKLGRLFGSNNVAPTNIAGMVIVACLVLLLISFCPTLNLAEDRKVIYGLISSALAFIFGASTKE